MSWTKERLEEVLGMQLADIRWRALSTHVGPHFDDVLATVLLRHYGNELFPGISRSDVLFAPFGQNGVDWKTIMRQGHIPVGIWGSPFDDHVNREDRDRCAASLVADFLVLSSATPLYPAVGYALLADCLRRFDFRTATDAPFIWHYAPMMKEAGYNEVPDAVSTRHMTNLIMAEGETRHQIRTKGAWDNPCNRVPSLAKFIRNWQEEHRTKFGENMGKKMADYAAHFESNPICLQENEFSFHPGALLYKMQRVSLPQQTRDEVQRALSFFLRQFYESQVQFAAAERTMRKALTDHPTRIRGLTLLCLQNKNRYLQKVLRFLHVVGVLVQPDSESNDMAIFWNTGDRLSSDRFVAATRRAELEKAGRSPDGLDLTAEGNVAGWYWHRKDNYLLWRNPVRTALDRRDFQRILAEVTA